MAIRCEEWGCGSGCVPRVVCFDHGENCVTLVWRDRDGLEVERSGCGNVLRVLNVDF